jgi:hypothetical protein
MISYRSWKVLPAAFLAIFFVSSGAIARGESIASLISAGIDAACAEFAAVVSSAEGTFGSRNQFGCLGAFQFCPATFVQYFTGTADDFLNNPSLQVNAWTDYERTQWALAKKGGLTSLIGQALTFGGKTVNIDASAILMACQFGCGKFGKLAKYVAGHDCDASNVKDGNGVSVCSYLIRGVGHVASCFTGEPATPVVSNQNEPPVSRSPTVSPKPSPNAPVSSTSVVPGNIGSPASACVAGSEFGTEGPIEIVVGHYTLRFGGPADINTVKKYLDLIDKR